MLFQCAIISSIVAAVSGACGSAITYTNKDCVGHDIAPSGSDGFIVRTFEECHLDCHSIPNCQSFEFDSITKKCYFKDYKCSANEMTPTAIQLSYSVCNPGLLCPAVTAYPNKDCVGHDMAGISGTYAANAFECRSICNAQYCISFEYDSFTQKCYPKDYQCAGAEITASAYPTGELTYYVCGGGTCQAVTAYTDKDCVGHDIATISGTAAATVADCQAICGSDPMCSSFVYAFTTQKCYPKNYKCTGSEITASTFPAGAISYYVCPSSSTAVLYR